MSAFTVALMAALLAEPCGASCPVPPKGPVATGEYRAVVEVRDGQRVLHRASGAVLPGEKVHIGGKDLRNLGFDIPDYEVSFRPEPAVFENGRSRQKAWTST